MKYLSREFYFCTKSNFMAEAARQSRRVSSSLINTAAVLLAFLLGLFSNALLTVVN